MKYLIPAVFFATLSIYSQNDKSFSCDEIKRTIIDESLFDTLSNGKLIAKIDYKVTKIYKISIEDGTFYYLTRPLMKKVKNSIKKNNCTNIRITKVDTSNDPNFKIVRYKYSD